MKRIIKYFRNPTLDIFNTLIIIWRWISLILAAAIASYLGLFSGIIIFAFLYNLFHSLFWWRFPDHYKRVLELHRWISLPLDSLASFFIVALSGHVQIFALYLFSPIMLAALYYDRKGAVSTSVILSLGVLGFVTKYDLVLSVSIVPQLLLFGALAGTVGFLVHNMSVNFPDKWGTPFSELQNYFADSEEKAELFSEVIFPILELENFHDVAEAILETITEKFHFDRSLIGFYDKEENVVENWILSKSVKREHINDLDTLLNRKCDISKPGPMQKAIVGQRVEYIQPSLIRRTGDKMELPHILKSNAFLIVPLVYKGESIGILIVDNDNSSLPFSDADQKIMVAFSKHITLSIVKAKRFAELKAIRIAVFSKVDNKACSALQSRAELAYCGVVASNEETKNICESEAIHVLLVVIDSRTSKDDILSLGELRIYPKILLLANWGSVDLELVQRITELEFLGISELNQSIDHLVNAIMEISRGNTVLNSQPFVNRLKEIVRNQRSNNITDEERVLLTLLHQGNTNKAIASLMEKYDFNPYDEDKVKRNLRKIREKLDLTKDGSLKLVLADYAEKNQLIVDLTILQSDLKSAPSLTPQT